MKHMDVLYGIENPVFKDLKHDRNLFLKNFYHGCQNLFLLLEK